MDFFRVGEKVLSFKKLEKAVMRILQLRASGSTQSDVAEKLGVDRSFVSYLEGLGEVRKGIKTALIAFPVSNKKELEELALDTGIDYVLVLSHEEREDLFITRPGGQVFNDVIEILSELVDYDVIIMIASDMRIQQAEKLFGYGKVVGISLGKSPLKSDVEVDMKELKTVFDSIITSRKEHLDEKGRKRKFRFFKKKSLR